jgi:hypothetical protein
MSANINSIRRRAQDLEAALKGAAPAQAPQKTPIDTGAELHVKGLRELVGEKLKSIKEIEKPAVEPTSSSETKKTTISFLNKVVCVKYIGINGAEEDEIVLETTHWLIAAIMNLFAKIFPSCVQGAAKFSIDDQTHFVRRALIQEKLHIQINRHEFKDEPKANTLLLKVLSFNHFQSEDVQAQTKD